jgi:hypothetical protein
MPQSIPNQGRGSDQGVLSLGKRYPGIMSIPTPIMRCDQMKRLAIASALLILCGFLWWYTWVLSARTEFLKHGTNLANGTIHLVYLACALSLALALYVVARGVVRRYFGYAIVAAALVPTIGFLLLNLSETVCMSKKAASVFRFFQRTIPW